MQKTYKKTIEKPRLEITYDDYCESPRKWSNLGYFITVDSRYYSPDQEKDIIQSIVKETGNIATSQENHIKLIKKEIKENTNEKVIAIFPVVKHEHGNVHYSIGKKHGFDYSNNGFYIVTNQSQKLTGAEKKDFEKVIKSELDDYNSYVNGEIYQFILYDENGEIEDYCGGFYDIKNLKEYLPKEWHNEDLNNYFTA